MQWATAYVFNRGHRIRLAVSSSNSPRFSANPNNNLLVREGGPLLVAANTVHYGGQQASSVMLPVVDLAKLPDNVLHKARLP